MHVSRKFGIGGCREGVPSESRPESREPSTSVPGLVGEIVRHTLANSYVLQPSLALAGALAFSGALFGRKVSDEFRTRPNLMTIGLARSGGGKEAARETNKRIATATQAHELIGPEGIASTAGLLNAIEARPSLLFQIDEVGRFLRGSEGGSPIKYDIITTLMKLFTSSGTTYTLDAFKDMERTKQIPFPNCNVYGTSVPTRFLSGLRPENILDGFYGRLLIFEGNGKERIEPAATDEVPAAIVDDVAYWKQFEPPAGDLAEISGARPFVVPYKDDAKRIIKEFATRVHAIIDNSHDDFLPAIWVRAIEKARKIALIYACSESRHPQIGNSAAEYAVELVDLLTERAVALAAGISENETETQSKRVVDIIERRGVVSASDLCRLTQWLKSYERKAMLKELDEAGVIQTVQVKLPNGGRPKSTYIWKGNGV